MQHYSVKPKITCVMNFLKVPNCPRTLYTQFDLPDFNVCLVSIWRPYLASILIISLIGKLRHINALVFLCWRFGKRKPSACQAK